MLSKILQYRDNRIVKNLSFLGIIQFTNYLLPVITLPYLVNKLGSLNFGVLSFSQAYANYYMLVLDYGFNLSITRQIARERADKDKLDQIFSQAIVTKLAILAVLVIVFLPTLFLFDVFKDYTYLYILSFSAISFQSFFPIWFFQGMERMQYITYLNVGLKLLYTILIFTFVRSQTDFYLVPLFNCVLYFTVFITSVNIIIRKFGVKFRKVGWSDIKVQLKDGWYVFTSAFLGGFLSTSGTFFLGIFAGKEIAGIYASIEKLVRAFLSLFSPVNQALYPYVCGKFSISDEEGLNAVKKTGKYIVLFAFAVCVVLIIASPLIIRIIYNSGLSEYAIILKLLSVWALFSIFNNILGYQILIASNRSNIYFRFFLISSIISTVLFFVFTRHFQYYAITIGMLLGESLMTVMMFRYIKKTFSKIV